MDKITDDKTKVIKLAIITALSPMIIPYTNQKATPTVKMLYMASDRDEVSRVLIT